jgi:hypothetical protein
VTEHKTVYLLNWWMASFDPSLEGIAPITREGTPVPTSLIPKVRRRAKRFGLSLTTKPPRT